LEERGDAKLHLISPQRHLALAVGEEKAGGGRAGEEDVLHRHGPCTGAGGGRWVLGEQLRRGARRGGGRAVPLLTSGGGPLRTSLLTSGSAGRRELRRRLRLEPPRGGRVDPSGAREGRRGRSSAVSGGAEEHARAAVASGSEWHDVGAERRWRHCVGAGRRSQSSRRRKMRLNCWRHHDFVGVQSTVYQRQNWICLSKLQSLSWSQSKQ
jgi:hypothetical protein